MAGEDGTRSAERPGGAPATAAVAVESIIDVDGDLSGQVAVGSGILQIRATDGGYVVVNAPDVPRVERRSTPLRALGRRPRVFVDRTADRAAARTAAADRDALGFTGPPGMGKSTLLHQVAREVADAESATSVLLVDARERPVEDVLHEVFCLLYDTDRPYLPLGGRLRTYLEGYDGVLLVDDADFPASGLEHLLDVLPEAGVVVAGTAAFPVTLMQTRALGPLPDEDAAGLLAATGGVRDPDVARTVIAASAGVPGRVAVAAGALASGGSNVAAAEAARSPLPDDSADLRVLGIVCAARGAGLPAQELASVAGSAGRARAEALVGRGLLRRHENHGSVRYVAPGVVLAAMAGSAFAAEGLDSLLVELVASPAALVAAEPAELSLGVSLVEAAAEAGRWRDVAALAPALEDALARSGRWGQWQLVLQRLLAAARADGAEAVESRTLHQLGTLALCLGDLSTARQLLGDALALREAAGDDVGAQATRHNLDRLQTVPLPRQPSGPSEPPPKTVPGPPPGAKPWRRRLLIAGVTAAVLLGATVAARGVVLDGGTPDAPLMSLSPTAVAFGERPVGTAARRDVVVRNSGGGELVLGGAVVQGGRPGEFTVSPDGCASLGSERSCRLDVDYVPTSAGASAAMLRVSARSGLAQTVRLSGQGVPPPAGAPRARPAALDFGKHLVGKPSGIRTVTIDVLDGPLPALGPPTIGGRDRESFAVRTTDCGTPKAERCTVSVQFTATAKGMRQATLQVTAAAGTMSVPLSGTGSAAPDGQTSTTPPVTGGVPGLDPAALDLGTVPVGTNATGRLTVRNTGSATLRVAGATVTGAAGDGFAVVSACGDPVPAKGSCDLVVTFAPAATGEQRATVSVRTDGSPQTVTATVVGTGAPAPDTVGPRLSLSDVSVEALSAEGAPATYAATAQDDVDGAVTVSCTPPSGAQFPLGTTPVTCAATDAAGNESTGTLTVSVVDTTPPVLTVSSSVRRVTPLSTDTPRVFFDTLVRAVDAVDGNVPVACTPSSGTTFPALSSIEDKKPVAAVVACGAQDARGNRSAATFSVYVVYRDVPVS